MLQRVVDIIFTLAAENMSLRGHHEVQGELLGSEHFLAHVELVAKYDLVLEEPLNKPKGSVRRPTIKNELIALLIRKIIRQHLIKEIQAAPFFSVIGERTKYISKIEQFSSCYRYVVFNADVNTAAVRETLLRFMPETNQSAAGVANIRDTIKEAGLYQNVVNKV